MSVIVSLFSKLIMCESMIFVCLFCFYRAICGGRWKAGFAVSETKPGSLFWTLNFDTRIRVWDFAVAKLIMLMVVFQTHFYKMVSSSTVPSLSPVWVSVSIYQSQIGSWFWNRTSHTVNIWKTHTYTHTDTHAKTNTQRHTHTHTHTHTHAYTHKHTEHEI